MEAAIMSRIQPSEDDVVQGGSNLNEVIKTKKYFGIKATKATTNTSFANKSQLNDSAFSVKKSKFVGIGGGSKKKEEDKGNGLHHGSQIRVKVSEPSSSNTSQSNVTTCLNIKTKNEQPLIVVKQSTKGLATQQEKEDGDKFMQPKDGQRSRLTAKKRMPSPSPQTKNNAKLEDKKKEAMQLVYCHNQTPGEGSVIFDEELVCREDLENIQVRCRPSPQVFGAYKNSHIIDSGSFGRVHSVTSEKGMALAVKEIPKTDGNEIDYQEILAPLGLRDHGIVKMLAITCTINTFWIVMEDSGKSLRKVLSQGNEQFIAFKNNNFMELIKQGFGICQYLERHALSHRDIKPENVCVRFVDGFLRLVLVDFGSCQPSQDPPKYAAHTHEFLPPKIVDIIHRIRVLKEENVKIDRIFFEEKADAWGMALTLLWVFLDGRHVIDLVNRYSHDPNLMSQQRVKVMKMIMALQPDTNWWYTAKMESLGLEVLTIFSKVLKVNNDERWNAFQALCCLSDSSPKQKKQRLEFCQISKMKIEGHQEMPIAATQPSTNAGFDAQGMGLKIVIAEKPQFQGLFTTYDNVPDMKALTECGATGNDKAIMRGQKQQQKLDPMEVEGSEPVQGTSAIWTAKSVVRVEENALYTKRQQSCANTAAVSQAVFSNSVVSKFKFNFGTTHAPSQANDNVMNIVLNNPGNAAPAPTSHVAMHVPQSPAIDLTRVSFGGQGQNIPNFDVLDDSSSCSPPKTKFGRRVGKRPASP